MFHIAILFGGPSNERGVSINSARSLCDNLEIPGVSFSLFYVTAKLEVFQASRSMLYQNTPDDFEFRLHSDIRFEDSVLCVDDAIEHWKQADIVFPAGHGEFFEDGVLASLLEEAQVKYVGTPAENCLNAFDKARALEILESREDSTEHTRLILDSELAVKGNLAEDLALFRNHHCETSLVVKPSRSGSSLGVRSCPGVGDAVEHVERLRQQGFRKILVEPNWKELGWSEFTIMLVESTSGKPVPLVPIEVDCEGVFEFRNKYLPSSDTRLKVAGEFSDATIDEIRERSKHVFQWLGLRDFGRLDGWISPQHDVLFSDFNVISGLEQNSFFFIQFAHVGFSPREALHYLVDCSSRRQGISHFPPIQSGSPPEKTVDVLFGGASSERQVSVQSGFNVASKLKQTGRWKVESRLFQRTGEEYCVRTVPFQYTFFHTTEDIEECCERHDELESRLLRLRKLIRSELTPNFPFTNDSLEPVSQTLDQYLAECVRDRRFVFLALHGADGENGMIQGKMSEHGIPYNNSGPAVSAVCSDKSVANAFVDRLRIPEVKTAERIVVSRRFFAERDKTWFENTWRNLTRDLVNQNLLIKPTSDGCSTGVARLANGDELSKYFEFVFSGMKSIPVGTLTHQTAPIVLPPVPAEQFQLEEFIQTIDVRVENSELIWDQSITPWVEITIGVYESEGELRSMNPTVTVRAGEILTLEEKFQAGTGVNITPPPVEFVSCDMVRQVRDKIRRLGKSLGLEGFARIDAFLNCETGQLKIIEVNTLPGMTPATAIFHQSLAETPPIYPARFLELAIFAGLERARVSPESQLTKVFIAIDNNLENGYSALFPFQLLKKCLRSTESRTRKLFLETKRFRPDIAPLNWLCLVVGSINYVAAEMGSEDGFHKMSTCAELDDLIANHWSPLFDLCCRKNNNPTVPQRAMPFAWQMKGLVGKIAVVELGCSRGDIGRVLLEVDKFQSGDYFFSDWGDQTPAAVFENLRSIDKYLGIDLDIKHDDQWLLALWGLDDQRRSVLKTFYEKFPPQNSTTFKRLKGDASRLEQRIPEILARVGKVENLILVTSYMLYQLTENQRRELSIAIHHMEKRVKKKYGKSRFRWLNQGMDFMPDAQADLGNVSLHELRFEARQDNVTVKAKRLAKISDDTAKNVHPVEEQAVKWLAFPVSRTQSPHPQIQNAPEI